MIQRFPSHTPTTAPPGSRERLSEMIDRTGGAGPMVRTMAGSPSVLGGYLDLNRAMKRSSLPRAVSERISLAVQSWMGCELCIQAHTAGARAAGVPDWEIDLARQGTSGTPAIAAIVDYGLRVHVEPAAISDEDVASLRGFGYSDRDLLDVVGLVALNVLAGGINLVVGLEPEEPIVQAVSAA